MSGQIASAANLYQLNRANAVRAQLARLDASQFCSYVLRDEHSGAPIKQAPIHKSWHYAIQNNPSRRTLIWSHVESGKTNQLSIGRTLFRIGKDPSLRVAIVSDTETQAAKVLRSIKAYIERSSQLHQVFPDLQQGSVWNSDEIIIKRPHISKDPTIKAYGVHGAVLGSRVDLLLLDDILDFENTFTPERRDKVWKWIQSTLMGRLTADAEVLVVGTAWHPDDSLHRFAALPGYVPLRYPVMDEAGNPRWPEKFPLARIEFKRTELGSVEFARQMMCVARDDSTAKFKESWIQKCVERGKFKNLAQTLLGNVPPGFRIYTGVDLAVQEHSSADLTVFFTIAIHPNGDREVLWIEAGRWAGPEIIQRVISHHQRFGSVVIVENNAAQDYILQFTRAISAVPVKAFTTTARGKAHPEFGVEGMAVEMENAKWIIPSQGTMNPEVQAWINDMLRYSPEDHTGDRLMASWFAVEGARRQNTTKASAGTVNWQKR